MTSDAVGYKRMINKPRLYGPYLHIYRSAIFGQNLWDEYANGA